MQNVTLIGLRPRAVGNSIENLYNSDGGGGSSSTVGAGGSGVQQQSAAAKLPCLAGTGGSASTSKMATQQQHGHGPSDQNAAVRTIRVQQLYDDPHNATRHNRGGGGAENENSVVGGDGAQKLGTRLPTIAGGGSSGGGEVGGSAPCLKSDSSVMNNKKMSSSSSMVMPMSPETAMKLYMHKLTPFEQHEIFDYQKVRPPTCILN